MPSDLKSATARMPATIALIAANVAVFLLANLLTGQAARVYSMQALSLWGLAHGRWWTLLTSMFMHGSLTHILFNMFSLYYLGYTMERLFGSRSFLGLYFVSGLAGGLAYVAWSYLTGAAGWVIGASGAIFGLFGAYGVILAAESVRPVLFRQASAKSSLGSFLAMLAFNVIYGFTGGIAWQAHLGGLAAGAVLGFVLYRRLLRRAFRR